MPIRSYNYKNGSVVGALLGLAAPVIEYFLDPKFQEMVKKSSLEEIVEAVATAAIVVAVPFAFGGYINQRFIIPASDITNKKLEVYIES